MDNTHEIKNLKCLLGLVEDVNWANKSVINLVQSKTRNYVLEVLNTKYRESNSKDEITFTKDEFINLREFIYNLGSDDGIKKLSSSVGDEIKIRDEKIKIIDKLR